MRDQQPAAASLLDMMQPVACNMPGNFAEREAHVILHQLAKCPVILHLELRASRPMRRAVPGICTTVSRSVSVDADKGSRLATPSMPMAPISTVRPSSMVLTTQTNPRLMKWMCLIGWSSTFDLLSPDQAYRLRNAQYPVQCRGRQREQKAIVDALVREASVERNYVRYGNSAWRHTFRRLTIRSWRARAVQAMPARSAVLLRSWTTSSRTCIE